MKTVKMEIVSAEEAGRLELIIRFVWGIIVGIVLTVYGIIASFAYIIQWFYILFLGKRHAGLQDFINKYVKQSAKLNAYIYLGTDERPPVMPED
jgi:Na+/H+ antiporter NhaC